MCACVWLFVCVYACVNVSGFSQGAGLLKGVATLMTTGVFAGAGIVSSA